MQKNVQLVIGLKGSGKSTYCDALSKQGVSPARKSLQVVSLDPTAETFPYTDRLSSDIRTIITAEQFEEAEKNTKDYAYGAGIDFVLKYLMANPQWLLNAIGGTGGGEGEESCRFYLFDFPGHRTMYTHLISMMNFVDFLKEKGLRVSVTMTQDARRVTDGYSFIACSYTPLISYMNLSCAHINIMMKADLMTEEDRSRLLLFISSDIKDVLRYENNKRGGADTRLARLSKTATFMLDGYNSVQRKFIVLDIRDEQEVQGYFAVLEDILGSGTPDDDE